MKAKGKTGKRVYLQEVGEKLPSRFVRHFRSFGNLDRYGMRKSFVRNSAQKLNLRGKGKPGNTQFGFITRNDKEWIRKIENPNDRLLADQSLKTLTALKNFMKVFDPDIVSKSPGDVLKTFNAKKSEIVQAALGNNSMDSGAKNARIQRSFKDLGLTIIGKGWLWDTGSTKFESTTERKTQLQTALEDLLSQTRMKAQSALADLKNLYMRQGDREEQKRIRDEEEGKAEKIRQKDREENLPSYQVVDSVNPLGYVTGRRNRNVDASDSQQVRRVRQNPEVRELDRSYFTRNRERVKEQPTVIFPKTSASDAERPW